MKRIDELGISPTPWGFTKPTKAHDATIYCDERIRGGLKRNYMFAVRYPYVGLLAGKDVLREQTANARLIKAAPKLYDAAERYVRFHDESCIHGNRTAREILADVHKAFLDLQSALAEAAGESVVNK